MRLLYLGLFAICLATPLGKTLAATRLLEDSHSVIALSYMRIDEPSMPAENLSMDNFLNHMKLLATEDFKILSLPNALEKIETGKPIPEKSVVIILEGLHHSTWTKAIPYLLQKNIPFTLFYASNQLSQNNITAQGLKTLAANPAVTIGIMPADNKALSQTNIEDVRRTINSAIQKHRDIFGRAPEYFSYPNGEYSKDYVQIIENSGFKAAFGRHAGTIHSGQNLLTLPRFLMTELFGNIERFRIILNALPLPVTHKEPAFPNNVAHDALVGFTVDSRLKNTLGGLSCILSGGHQTKIEILGHRVELRADQNFDDKTTRINCTIPIENNNDKDIQWRWFGMYLTHPP